MDLGCTYEPAGKKTLGGRLASFCAAIALLIFLFITLWLAAVSLTETTDMNLNNPVWERVDFFTDNYLFNALWLLLFTAVAALWMKLTEKIPHGLITAVCLLWVTVFGIVFVLSARSVPSQDSYIVTNAAYLASKGDASALEADYFKFFPYQLGYVLYSELLIRLFGTENNYLSIEVVNVLCLAVSYFALLCSVRLLWGNGRAYKMTALLTAICLPPILFASFTYGTLPGLMFTLLALWQVLSMKGTGSDWIHGVAAALCIGLGVAIKKNFTIAFVAIAIILLLRLIRKFTYSGVLCILLSVVSVLGVSAGVQSHYEKRFGLEFGEGIPMISWAAMGLNESYIAPGWYDSHHIVNFRESGMDPDEASRRVVETIKERLEEMKQDPDYTNAFFSEKNKSQWNEPTCQSIWTNQVRGTYGDRGALAEWICGEGEKTVKTWMNLLQQFLYVMAAVGVYLLLKRRRIEDALIPTALVGGFLYHTLFEAKSQYMIPYLVFLLPLAAYGVAELTRGSPRAKETEVSAFGLNFKILMEYTKSKQRKK